MNSVNYSYDLSGNLTADGTGHNYQYDAASRMVNVDGGSTTSSRYDSANRRVKKVAGGTTTHYIWEGSQVIAEYDGNTGALISEYVFAGSRMVEREQSGVVRYFLQDRLSTRVITDASGTLVGREDHLPFGEDAGTGSGETEKHRFTSYERDAESGTDYAINRQYQNANGRFMQPDSAGPDIGDPQSWNRNSYVFNDPVNLKDHDGLFPVLTGLINFFASLTLSYSVSVKASPDVWIIPVPAGFLGGPIGATSLGLSPQVGAVIQGVTEARKAFARPACRNLFGNNDPNALLTRYLNNNLIRVSNTYPENGNPSHQIPFDDTGIGARTS